MSSLEQLGFSFQPQRRVFSVRDLVSTVRTGLEREYTDVWIGGEISNYRPAESGHLYFTLKDGEAQLRVVMFRMQARLLRFRPENGMEIVARGRVTVYESRGELQLIAEYLEPKGAGALQIAFEQLKGKLAAEGLFDSARKKPIPALPRCIGIVTSPRGAAIHDILNVMRRRHASASLLIYPAQVQGESAASEVSAGLKYFNRTKNVDVIVIARGGGSLEDLAAFNNEGLARAIASSSLPVISAVGHETDFTICDFVADLRAPTPSAAAELVIESKHRIAEHLAHLHQRLGRAARYQLIVGRNRLTELAQHGAFAGMQDFLGRRSQRLDELVFRMAAAFGDGLRDYARRLEIASARVRHFDFRRSLAMTRNQLGSGTDSLLRVMRNQLGERRGRLNELFAKLDALSPMKILDRGYALVFDSRGKLVKDTGQLNPGDEISGRVAHGTFVAEIKKTQS